VFLPLVIYGCVVFALLIAELGEDQKAQFFFKPLAALGFVLLALLFGALQSQYGQIILVGLVACALGDVFLLPKDKPTLFKLGMAAFALGHIAYAAAFFTSRSAGEAFIPFILVFSACGAAFLHWLWRYLPKDMRLLVLVYTLIIVIMTIMGTAMDKTVSGIIVVIPAVMFAASDMFVAKDRFASPHPKNALGITPLYFGAQALFALSVQM